jgi:hypothetical protein
MKVQGMPPETERAIQRVLQDFIWDGKSTPCIALNTLEWTLEEGGMNLLNIKARNEAMTLCGQHCTLTSPQPV